MSVLPSGTPKSATTALAATAAKKQQSFDLVPLLPCERDCPANKTSFLEDERRLQKSHEGGGKGKRKECRTLFTPSSDSKPHTLKRTELN